MAATGWLALTGCDGVLPSAGDGPGAPMADMAPRLANVAWVFGTGGPRGFVHVGVLKALAELGLKPDLVVGASIGAVTGCLYAAGMASDRMESIALEIGPTDFVRPDPTGSPWLSGAGLAGWIDETIGGRALEALNVRFAAVAADLATREPVAFTRGNAGLAVQAACAIENRLSAVRIRGRRYVDADLVMPLPVRLARSLGARTVIAIDASAHEDKAPPGTERWREGDLRKRALTRPDAESADLLLHPEFGYYAGLDRSWRERVIRAGYEHTMAAAMRLRAMHATAP